MLHSSGVATIVTAIVTLMLISAGILALTKRIKLPFTIILVLEQHPEIRNALLLIDQQRHEDILHSQ